MKASKYILELQKLIDEHGNRMKPRQLDFVKSVLAFAKKYDRITGKQIVAIGRIANYIHDEIIRDNDWDAPHSLHKTSDIEFVL